MIQKTISIEQTIKQSYAQRPTHFDEFVGQNSIKSVISTALQSAEIKGHSLGHTLFSGQSGYGKTTLATIIGNALGVTTHTITGYAINKPSDMVSLLNSLQKNDILFIDEIHRLKPAIEEVLYIAMEDFCIDMVMPDGNHVRLPLEHFTLIGATTKSEALSEPLKNRFVYSFHLAPYTLEEKKQIIARYLTINGLAITDHTVLDAISEYVSSTPRDITTLIIQLRDYCIVHGDGTSSISLSIRQAFVGSYNLQQGGLQAIHIRYLAILETYGITPVGLTTLAAKLGISEKAIENDVEPLLFSLGKIEKTTRGRVLRT